MRHISSRRRAENEPFAPDVRPEAADFVYCVGCGKQLGARTGLMRGRGTAITIYCKKCEGRDVNAWGESAPQTFCFRCGTKHTKFVELEPYRTIHLICRRCRPERAARYEAGDFAPLPPPEDPEEVVAALPAADGEVPAVIVEAVAAAEAAVEMPVVEEVEPEAPKRGRKTKNTE